MNLLKLLLDNGVAAAKGNGCAPKYVNGQGLVIEPEWHSQWRPFHCGVHEARRHVGCSTEGFHAGVEICYRVGMGWIDWGKAFPTPELACQESERVESSRDDAIHVGVEGCVGLITGGDCIPTRRSGVLENAILRLHDAVLRMECAPLQDWAKHVAELERAVGILRRMYDELWPSDEPLLREK
jgi:hypothetical protein